MDLSFNIVHKSNELFTEITNILQIYYSCGCCC